MRILLEKRFQSFHARKDIYGSLPPKLKSKLEIKADVKHVVKIQQAIQSFLRPFEEENSEAKPFFQ